MFCRGDGIELPIVWFNRDRLGIKRGLEGVECEPAAIATFRIGVGEEDVCECCDVYSVNRDNGSNICESRLAGEPPRDKSSSILCGWRFVFECIYGNNKC